MRSRSSWARPVALALAFALGLVMAAQPVAAGPLPPLKTPAKTTAPLAAAATARVAAMTPAELQSASAQVAEPAPSTSSPAFFKTGKGVAVLVLLTAGVGYACYSAVHDRNPVKSPIR